MKPAPNIPNHPIHPLCNLLRALPSRAAVAPDIPFSFYPIFFSSSGDFGGGDAFVVAVVPFADVRGYLYSGVGANGGGFRVGWILMGFLPGEFVSAAEVEEFEGAAGAVAGGDVAKDRRDVSGVCEMG